MLQSFLSSLSPPDDDADDSDFPSKLSQFLPNPSLPSRPHPAAACALFYQLQHTIDSRSSLFLYLH
jgi:hypothetical protein